MSEMNRYEARAPMCCCGNGVMKTLCSSTTKNPGRYFYKCPVRLEHKNSFLWCDLVHDVLTSASSSSFLPTAQVHCNPFVQDKVHPTQLNSPQYHQYQFSTSQIESCASQSHGTNKVHNSEHQASVNHTPTTQFKSHALNSPPTQFDPTKLKNPIQVPPPQVHGTSEEIHQILSFIRKSGLVAKQKHHCTHECAFYWSTVWLCAILLISTGLLLAWNAFARNIFSVFLLSYISMLKWAHLLGEIIFKMKQLLDEFKMKIICLYIPTLLRQSMSISLTLKMPPRAYPRGSMNQASVFYNSEWTKDIDELFILGLCEQTAVGNQCVRGQANRKSVNYAKDRVNGKYGTHFDYPTCLDRFRRLHQRYVVFKFIKEHDGVTLEDEVTWSVTAPEPVWNVICRHHALAYTYMRQGEGSFHALQFIFEAAPELPGVGGCFDDAIEISSDHDSISLEGAQSGVFDNDLAWYNSVNSREPSGMSSNVRDTGISRGPATSGNGTRRGQRYPAPRNNPISGPSSQASSSPYKPE